MKRSPKAIDRAINEIFAVLEGARESEYIGEAISQLDHALQAAWHASQAGASEETILSALFHDIGHLLDPNAPQMAGLGVLNHEGIGAQYLRDKGCSEALATLVREHVQAKRYLCCRKPAYFQRLSDASRGTLEWQGGPMSKEEATAFEQSPLFKGILALRQWDEMAKDPEAIVPRLPTYKPMLRRHLEGTV